MYSLGTWFVSGIYVLIPRIKELKMMIMIIIIIIIITIIDKYDQKSMQQENRCAALYTELGCILTLLVGGRNKLTLGGPCQQNSYSDPLRREKLHPEASSKRYAAK
jgi:uncharacterized membrane protein